MKDKVLLSIPIASGIISFAFLVIYIWDAYHLRSSLMLSFCFIPIISIFAVYVSIVIRKLFIDHKVLWLLGLLSSLIGLLGFLTIEVLTWYNLGMALG